MMIKLCAILSLLLFCFGLKAQTFEQIYIEIKQDSIDELEQHPYTNEDVHGNFVFGVERINNVEIHYRGAYYLWTLIRQGDKRNWKVKTSKSPNYRNRREWNFNYETHLRQRMAYFLMDKAGVPCVSAEHVVLHVNNVRQGIYLRYEDPDNKQWLLDTFNDKDGDLYKAAYDMPNETKYFADLTYLGDSDADYFLHYRKQTNDEGVNEYDYSSIRTFTSIINHTPDSTFSEVIEQHFDVESFINYLVVANFISHWDGYPYRPKNYFLYKSSVDGKWSFIPWDMDGTFQNYGDRNPIRVNGSAFHYFDGPDPYKLATGEPTERPLIWRLMKIEKFRNAYIVAYKNAMETYLREDYLYNVIDSLNTAVKQNSISSEQNKFNTDVSAVKNFIYLRSNSINSELAQYELGTNTGHNNAFIADVKIYPNPSSEVIHVNFMSKGNALLQIFNMNGQLIIHKNIDGQTNDEQKLSIDVSMLNSGNYILLLKQQNVLISKVITVHN